MANVNTESMPDVVNAVVNEANISGVPTATMTNFPEVGAVLSQPSIANSFWSVLMNKVAMTIVRSKLWNNPLAPLKKGSVPYGEIIEEIAMNPAQVKDYETDEDTQLAVVKADIKAAYHGLTHKKFTCVSMNRAKVKMAFQSPEKFAETLTANINTLYSGKNIYEYETMRDTLQFAVRNGHIVKETMSAPTNTQESADAFVEKLRGLALAFSMPSTSFNKYIDMTGAVGQAYKTWTDIEDLYVLLPNAILSKIDVYALSKAFNVEYEKFIGHVIGVDSLGTDAETSGKTINAVICDKALLQVYEYENTNTEFFNPRTLDYKYYYHFWDGFDISPFANAVALVEA